MTSSRVVIGIDQGTTYSKAVVLDEDGAILASAQNRVARLFPRRRWVEQDAAEIWSATLATLREALAVGRISGSQVTAVGLCAQMGTAVVWRRPSLEPVGRAISWQDTRTLEICEELNATSGAAALVSGPFVTNATGPKLRWLLENDVEVQGGIAHGDIVAGTVSSWLLANLTGGSLFATEYASASTSQLVDLTTLTYHDELLALHGVPRSALPEIRAPGDTFGVVDPGVLGAEVPVTAVLGDVPAAALGAGADRPGHATLSLGTGAFLQLRTSALRGAPGFLPLVVDADGYDVAYGGLSSASVSGAAIEWLRDGAGLIRDLTDVDGIGSQVDDSGGVFFVPAFAGQSSPPDPRATGLLIGLGQDVTRANIIRAVLDGLAYQVQDMVEYAETAAGEAVDSVLVTGGASISDVLMQTLADTLGRSLCRPRSAHMGALGAALRAGISAGVWSPSDDVLDEHRRGTQFDPHTTADRREEKRALWRAAVSRSRDWPS